MGGPSRSVTQRCWLLPDSFLGGFYETFKELQLHCCLGRGDKWKRITETGTASDHYAGLERVASGIAISGSISDKPLGQRDFKKHD
jgi:hypothetical protein